MSYKNGQRTFDAPVHRDSVSLESRYHRLASIQPSPREVHASFIDVQGSNGSYKRVRSPYALENQGPIVSVNDESGDAGALPTLRVCHTQTIWHNGDDVNNEVRGVAYHGQGDGARNGGYRSNDGASSASINHSSSLHSLYTSNEESLHLAGLPRSKKMPRIESDERTKNGHTRGKSATTGTRTSDGVSAALLEQINKRLQLQEKQISTVTETITRMSEGIDEVKKDQTELRANVEKLQQSMSKVEENISLMKQQKQSDNSELSSLKGICRDAQAAVDECKRKQIKIEGQIDSLQKKAETGAWSAQTTTPGNTGANNTTMNSTSSNSNASPAPLQAAKPTVEAKTAAPFGFGAAAPSTTPYQHAPFGFNGASHNADKKNAPTENAHLTAFSNKTNDTKSDGTNGVGESVQADDKTTGGSVSFTTTTDTSKSFTSTGSTLSSTPFTFGSAAAALNSSSGGNNVDNNSVHTSKDATQNNASSFNFTSCASAPVSSLTSSTTAPPAAPAFGAMKPPATSDATSKPSTTPFGQTVLPVALAPADTTAVRPAAMPASAGSSSSVGSGSAGGLFGWGGGATSLTSDAKTGSSMHSPPSAFVSNAVSQVNPSQNNTNANNIIHTTSTTTTSINKDENKNDNSSNNTNAAAALPFGFGSASDTPFASTATASTPAATILSSAASPFSSTAASPTGNTTGIGFAANTSNPFQPAAAAAAPTALSANAGQTNTSSATPSQVFASANHTGGGTQGGAMTNISGGSSSTSSNNPFGSGANSATANRTSSSFATAASPFSAFGGGAASGAGAGASAGAGAGATATLAAPNLFGRTNSFASNTPSTSASAFGSAGSTHVANTSSNNNNMFSMPVASNTMNGGANAVGPNDGNTAMNKGFGMNAAPFGTASPTTTTTTSGAFGQAAAAPAFGQPSSGGNFVFGAAGNGGTNSQGNGAATFSAPSAPATNILGVHQRKKTTRRY